MKKIVQFIIIMTFTLSVNAQNWKPDEGTPTVFDPDEVGTVTDFDGNVYKTARFGDTWWMLENLKNTHYNDGTPVKFFEDIEAVRPDGESFWGWFATDSYAYPMRDASYVEKYGLLYTWMAATDVLLKGGSNLYYKFNVHGGLLPPGWKVADTTAWHDLGRRIVGEENLIGDWFTQNTPQGGTETVFWIRNIPNLGLYLKKGRADGWKDNLDLPRANDKRWNKLNFGLVGAGKIGTDTSIPGTVPYHEGLDEFTWIWTDQFVHEDSTGSGKQYAYFSNIDNNFQKRSNSCCNHASVRGIMRVERNTPDSDGITKVGSVSTSDDFLIYPNRTADLFALVSTKNTEYKIYSSGNGKLSKSGYANSGENIIDISDLTPGLYILDIEGKQFKIIKLN